MLSIRAIKPLLAGIALAAYSACLGQAHAMSMQEAKAKCHDEFVPIVRECVHKKMAESGGSGYRYIPGCRAAIMGKAEECVARLIGGSETKAAAAARTQGGPSAIELPPPSGKGRIVILIAGKLGPDYYKDYAEDVAKLGYDTIILNGDDILNADRQGGMRLLQAIERAEASPHAVAGKIAVIGFSEGGGGALAYATRGVRTIAVVIAYYPETAFLRRRGIDLKQFVSGFKVPVLAFAGAKDTFLDCCLLATITAIDADAKALGLPFDLVVYPDASHDFIKGPSYRAGDAADAWKRTTAVLQQHLGE